MRHIPTSLDFVEKLKKLAKRLKGSKGDKHADALDRVARQHGYLHWRHVGVCLKATLTQQLGSALFAECHAIAAAEFAGKVKIVITGEDCSTSQPFVLFSTSIGDAWLIDPLKDAALCVVWRGTLQRVDIQIVDDTLQIVWDGRFELLGQFFSVSTGHPEIGDRAIAGYPLEGLREALERARTFDQRVHAIFDQPDAVEITDAVVRELVRAGWEEAAVRRAAAEGGRYSPSRNSILGTPQFGGDDDDDERLVG